MPSLRLFLALCFCAAVTLTAQTTTGDILGTVRDASGAVVADAKVTVRNLDTNVSHAATTSDVGTFRVPLLPAGQYELVVEKPGFAKYQQGPIVLRLNQQAEFDVNLAVSGTVETIAVTESAPMINTTNAEISTHFDTKRVSELPLSTNRNILNLATSIPGVAQISAGNSAFGRSGNIGTESGGLDFSSNGMRTRSNAFAIDGQDSYYPSTGGLVQSINNPDIVAEVRIVTNQFLPEYGRAAGSVLSVITKSGTNSFHGSAFWFHNSNRLNALTNAEKRLASRPTRALFRIENQFGGTFGGPVIKDKTFFFGSLMRWTDRRLGSGTLIPGAPTEEGRRLLQELAGNRPQVRALLENLPAGSPNGQTAPLTVGGRTVAIPLGNLTGSGGQRFDDWQYSYRVDHRFNDKHSLMARYMDDDGSSTGTGQLTPVGLSSVIPTRTRSATLGLTSSFGANIFNELRGSFWRYTTSNNAQNPEIAERIPSIEVLSLGLQGFNAATTRTGVGLAGNLPQFATLNNYQIQDSVAVLAGRHSTKFGIDFRRQEQFQFFLPLTRGRLEYATLQALVDDSATAAQINAPLRGGELITYLRYYDYFAFAQDEWRIRPNFTLSYGVRYETPGNSIESLAKLSERISGFYNNDPRYLLSPRPKRDTNNWAPRIGFNYRFGKGGGPLGWLTGEERLVLRGGYSRTYDVAFNNVALNIASSFPLLLAYTLPTVGSVTPNAFPQVESIRAGNVPAVSNPNTLTRTIVSADFRAPYADQYSMQLQRELSSSWAMTVGYVGTKGTALIQSIDGNPTLPAVGVPRSTRMFADRGVIRERCNCASSIYHSLQTSLEKRLSRGVSMAAHYTWSSFIDDASEVFNPSTSGEIAFPQDPWNRKLERGRSTYDRPHRFTINGLWELPFLRTGDSVLAKVAGGWQITGFLTLQSGAPFGVLNGADPGGLLTGNLVGTSTRPHLATGLDLSRMTVREIQAAGGGRLFRAATVQEPVGNLGRNVLRANGINRLDFGIVKNTRITENHRVQIYGNFFNATNTRDWGIPNGVFTSAAFLNEGAPEVPARKIQLGLRYTF